MPLYPDGDPSLPPVPARHRAAALTAPNPPGPKLAAQVARRIESDIIAAGWPVGEPFGSESDLRRRYRVSRAVLREAVRIVEHHRVAAMRRGPSGGLIVRAPDATPSARALAIYLAHLRTSVPDLVHVRLLLEPLAAGLAARELTEDGVRRLRAVCEREDAHPGMAAQDDLHLVLGELSGNPAVALFVAVLTHLTRYYASSRPRTPAEVQRAKADSGHAHRAVVEAVVAGDLALVEHRLTVHIRALGAWFGEGAQQGPVRGTRPAPGTSTGPGSRAGPGIGSHQFDGPSAGGGLKLAEVVADRIRADIVRAGLAEGEVAGSEAELLARYGISRAVLREAVGLLEIHSVARMRRGPGGGLVVDRPDPAATVEAITLYLECRGVDFEILRVVRDAVELGCVELVVARRDEPEVARRLRAAVRADAAGSPGYLEELSHAFHTELAELTGNPVLALFQRVLTALAARHLRIPPDAGTAPSGRAGPTDGAMGAEVARAHGSIAEAVLAGDAGLAKHRMRRHLDALGAGWGSSSPVESPGDRGVPPPGAPRPIRACGT